VGQGSSQTFGPYTASQIEASTYSVTAIHSGPTSYPQATVSVKNGTFTSDSDPGDYQSTDYSYATDPQYRAFVRDYAPIWTFWFRYQPFYIWASYYVRVNVTDSVPGPSSVMGRLSISSY
jgi:hypothetical protein